MPSTSENNISAKEVNKRVDFLYGVGIVPSNWSQSNHNVLEVTQNGLTVAINYTSGTNPPQPDHVRIIKRPGVNTFSISSVGNIPIYANQWVGGVATQVQDVQWNVDVNVNGVDITVDRSTNPPRITLTPIKA